MGNSLFPRICVCLPVYNGEQFIVETLDSLVSQDYQNFEILVCDNLSTDGTKKIVEDYISKNEVKISYIFNPTKGSAEENWNYVLKKIPEDAVFATIYHADDIYDSSILSKQAKLIDETNVGAVFTLSTIIDENGTDITKAFNHTIDLPEECGESIIFDYQQILYLVAKYRNFIRTPTFFFSVNAVRKFETLFDKKFKSSADLDFWLRIAKEFKIAIVRSPLLSYRVSKTQGSYAIMKGREEPSDFFNVIDFHLENLTDVAAKKYYKAYKGMDMIICSINLLKSNKRAKASDFLNKSLKVNQIPQLLKIHSGLKHYFFGFILNLSMKLDLHNQLIKKLKL